MKTIILCGGAGSRLSEETYLRPKPMVTVGGRPILWHIMNIYGQAGFNEFVLALGYKAEMIKEYFYNYHALNSDFEIDLESGKIRYLKPSPRNWKVELVETGEKTMTGGRVKRLEPYVRPHGTFMLTYGDGVCNVDLKALLAYHKSHGKLATVTAVRAISRFGNMVCEAGEVRNFKEKPQSDEGRINGGFFILEPEVFDFIDGDSTVLEASPLERLAAERQLMAFDHRGFWHCMDNVRDRQILEELWASGEPPWKCWKD